MEEDYTIRRYKEGDEKEINLLFNEIFNEKRSEEEWRWKFKKNPLGHINLITVAEFCGKIVGQYANLPVLYKYQDKTLKFGLPVDNFVHPEFRGGVKGMQGKMFEYQHEVAMMEDIGIGIGFPNRDAYIIGKRVLKYKDIGKISVLFRRLNWRIAVKKRLPWVPAIFLKVVQSLSSIGYKIMLNSKKQLKDNDIKISIIDSFDERFNLFWDKIKDQYEIIGVRDQRYLNWRYKNPAKNYEVIIAERGEQVAGYMVTNIKTDGSTTVGYIVDMLSDDSGVDSILINYVLIRFASRKVDFSLCWMLPHTQSYMVLKTLGFIENKTTPINLVYYLFDSNDVAEPFIRDYKNWYLTMGDSDTF